MIHNIQNHFTIDADGKITIPGDLEVTGIITNNGGPVQGGGGGGGQWSLNSSDIYFSTGNVGIGTTGPASPLHVHNTGGDTVVRFARSTDNGGGSSYLLAINELGDHSAQLDMQNGGGLSKVRIETAGDSFFNGGNVGIGTDSPLCDLETKAKSGQSEVRIGLSSADGTQNAAIAHVDEEGAERLSLRVGGFNSGVDKMTILNTGNVGIGTADPGSRLHVYGHGALSGIILGTDPNNANSASIVSPGNYIEDGIESRGLDLIASNHGTTDNGTFRFFTSHRATGERMRIDSAGKVGIGTEGAPQWGTLQVNNVTGDQTPNIDAWNQSTSSEDAHAIIRVGVHPGGGDAYYRAVVDGEDEWSFGLDSSDSNKFKINSSGALGNAEDRLTITGGGWVGIGKTSPASALHVVGSATIESSGPVLVLKDIDGGDVNTQTGFISYRDNDNTERAWVGFGSATSKDFNVRNNIGDLHLRTAAPSTKVYAQGSEVITAANIANYGGGTGSGQWNSNGSDIYFNLGNAGIGTNTPQHKLDVAGNAQISGPLGILDDVSIAKEGPVSQPDLIMRGINENTSDFSSDYLQTTYISSSMYNSDPTGTACQPFALYNIANSNNGTTEPGPRLVLKHGVLASGSFAPTTSYLELRTSSPLVEGEKLARFEMFGNGDVKIGNIEKTSTDYDNNTYATFTSDGNVGIGTTAPVKELQVNGTALLTTTGYIHETTGHSLWLNPYEDSLNGCSVINAYTSGSTQPNVLALNTNGGNVGIGTATPAAALEIAGDNAFTALRITDHNTGGNAANMLGIVCAEYSGSGGNPNVIEAYNSSEISFATGGAADRLRIDNVGRVGIGTASPASALHVVGASTIESSGPVLVLKDIDGGDVNTQTGFISYRDNDNTERAWVGFGSASTKDFAVRSNIGDLHLLTSAPSTKVYAQGSEVITAANIANYGGGGSSVWSLSGNDAYYSNGNVGIGTASPDSSLQFSIGDGTSNINAGISLRNLASTYHILNHSSGDFKIDQVGWSASGLMIQKDTGNVGIGIAAPDAKLHVDGNVIVGDTFYLGGLSGTNPTTDNTMKEIACAPYHWSGANAVGDKIAAIRMGSQSTAQDDGWIMFQTAHQVNDSSQPGHSPISTRMTIEPGGDVGIGTATPGSPLHIEGAYDRTLYLTTTDTNGQYMMIQGAPDSSVNPVRPGHNLPAAGAGYIGNARPLVTQGSGGGAPENFAIRAESGIEFATDGPNLRMSISHEGKVNFQSSHITNTGQVYQLGKQTGLADGEYTINYVWANDAASEASLADYNGRSAGMGVYKNAGESWTSGYLWTVSSLGNHFYSWNDNSGVLRMSNSMSQIGGTGGTVVGAQTSDERLKDIDEEFNYGLSEVLKLKPISFTLKNDESDTKKLGFGAQTTQEVIPESVGDSGDCIDGYDVDEEDEFKQTPKSEDTILNMEYVQLIPVLTKAIQELKAENDELKERLQSIEDWRGNSV